MLSIILSTFAVATAYVMLLASNALPNSLSPQGCRMSYMSPSYVLQAAFDTSWTPLATRYSLLLYREVGWDSNQPSGTPVLFVPGNAGSSHQVRSIASSAARQYFHSPGQISSEFSPREIKPLDVYAVDFNEDLSAFHGPTLFAERTYVLDALRYISSIYPPETQVLVLGHSMGGVVATSLLPSTNISAIITMSTPHTLPPARFDRRIEEIFRDNQHHLQKDPTPIISLCGGATDLMIPSESCVLPAPTSDVYRSTLFTSALEGCWTGVGHQEMVWCHQVRWQIARTALELSIKSAPRDSSAVLDVWLKDGHNLPVPALPGALPQSDAQMEILNGRLVLPSPKFSGTRLFFMPFSGNKKFFLYVSKGQLGSKGPRHPASLQVEIFSCERAETGPPSLSASDCSILNPSKLRLLPETHINRQFPVPKAGSDESEGVALFEAELSPHSQGSWIAVQVSGADGRGWLSGGFAENYVIKSEVTTATVIFSPALVPLSEMSITGSPLITEIQFPRLLSNVLLVYRLTARFARGFCSDQLLEPLIIHTSGASETHYHRLLPTSAPNFRPALLHTHSSAPYISTNYRHGVNLTLLTSSESKGCAVDRLELTIDWWATLGRWGHRYWPAVATWSVGIVAFVVWNAMGATEFGKDKFPSVADSLSALNKTLLPRLMVFSFAVSFLPLPADAWLGNIGEPMFSLIAPLIIAICVGLVNLSWWILRATMTASSLCVSLTERISRPKDANLVMKPRKLRITIASTAFTFLLIFLLVPWQVAFLGVWIIHYYTCVISSRRLKTPTSPDSRSPSPVSSSTSVGKDHSIDNHNTSSHILLLMTWLLPLTAPVLGVWVRTLATAGLTTPFDGDHNFLYVAPFILLVDWCWTCVRKLGRVELLQKSENEKVSTRWSIVVVALTAFFYGPRFNYLIFDFASASVGVIFALRIGPRYWRTER